MKEIKYTAKAILTTLFLAGVVWSCEDSAPFSIDPVVTSTSFTFEPSHGSAGNSVKITGAGLSDVEKVSFGNTEAEILQKSNEEITTTVPVGAISSKIKLVKTNSVMTSKNDFTVDETPVPTIMEFLPAIAGSGDLIAITGNQLDMVDSVYIGNLKAEIQPGRTETAMEIVTPVGLQTGKIRMFYQYMTSYGFPKVGESDSSTNLSLELPVIRSIEPDITTLNIGDELTITGSMMNEVTRVQFGEIDATGFTATDEVTLKVTVPEGATTGKIILTVPDGTLQSSTDFQVNLPAITSFFPGKGAEIAGGSRSISLVGTKLDLVQGITVGTTSAGINDQSATNIIFTISGSTSGVITLNTANGAVKSTVPFIITGDFWVVDFDNTFDPSRYSYADANTVNAGSVTTETSGPTGNYGHATGTTIVGKRPRVYIRSTDGGGYTVPDGFLLYTSNPNDVFFSLDVNLKNIPVDLLNEGGTSVDIEIYAFSSRVGSAAPNPPYGFSKTVTLPYVANSDTWHHISMELADLLEDTDLEGTATTGPAGGLRPDRLRIMTIFFTKSATEESPVEVNFDNAKFTIQ